MTVYTGTLDFNGGQTAYGGIQVDTAGSAARGILTYIQFTGYTRGTDTITLYGYFAYVITYNFVYSTSLSRSVGVRASYGAGNLNYVNCTYPGYASGGHSYWTLSHENFEATGITLPMPANATSVDLILVWSGADAGTYGQLTLTGLPQGYVTNSTAITGAVRVAKTNSNTISGATRITKPVAKTILGQVDILKTGLQTHVEGRVRVSGINTVQISGATHIDNPNERVSTATIGGKVAVLNSNKQTIAGQTRIGRVGSNTISGKVVVAKAQNATIQGNTIIERTESANISGQVKVRVVTPIKLPERWESSPTAGDQSWTSIDKDSTAWTEGEGSATEWNYPVADS